MKKFLPAILIMALLTLCLSFTAAFASADAPYDYYTAKNFPALSGNTVYTAVTWSELTNILSSDGTYIILFGGKSSEPTQAAIGIINSAAREYGINTIYNFDTTWDGKKLTVLETGLDLTAYKIELKDARLIIYNKNRAGSPIAASVDFEDLTANNTAGFDKKIRDVFDVISDDSGGKKVAAYDEVSGFDYCVSVYNTQAGAAIFTPSDGDVALKPVPYYELTDILESPGTRAFLFGGPWCKNTRAAIKFINEYAKKYNVDTVYTWDIRLDSDTLEIRETGSPYANLYVDLVNNYLTNIETAYDKNDNNAAHNVKYGQNTVNKLQVPFLFVYNKDNKDGNGNPAPILGSVEEMFEWEDIQPDYIDADGNAGVNYNYYTDWLDYVFSLVPIEDIEFPVPEIPRDNGLTATPTASKVIVNGAETAFDAYTINGNNYFKLRDLAYVINGTAKQFSVGWDNENNAISLSPGQSYIPVGGELERKDGGEKIPLPTDSKIFTDGKPASFTAYNIDGNNYFKLRDVGQTFDFSVEWDSGSSTIVIDTDKGYEQ
jgi:thiol-disulfide isomerase/thioredoxin